MFFLLLLDYVIYLKIQKQSLTLPSIQILKFMGIGLIVVAHWVAFFHAIKISNISITLGVISTGILFISFLEPLILRKKINLLEVIVRLLIAVGLFLILSYELNFLLGIIVALITTILAATFIILNKKYANLHSPSLISFMKCLVGL